MRTPGGLVALAVLNFFLAVPSLLMALFVYAFATSNLFDGPDPTFGEAPISMKLAFAGCIAIALLLVASGIGYLVRHKFLGRFVGNAFVVVSLTTAMLAIGHGSMLVTLGIATCAIYPIVTAVLINTTYRLQFLR